MGVVYRAEDTKLERTVALKFLAQHLLNDEEAKERFLREAQAAAALHHPNVCPVYEIDEVDGKTFISMAFLEGESLEERIAQGPLSIKDALDIARQAADGLDAAHEKGIFHRDIKPANIMVDPKGRATIMDFGLARLTEASRLTKLDTAMGTVAYMSPEQAQGMTVDSRSDLWSLGCVLYEMISGQRPFQGQYDQALLYEIVHEEPAALTGLRTGVPIELEFIVGECLAKDRDDRTGTAQEVARKLRTLAEKLKSGRSTILRSANLTAGVPATVTAGQTINPADALPRDSMVVRRSSHRTTQALAAVVTLAFLGLLAFNLTQAPPETLTRRFSFTPESLNSEQDTSPAAVSPDGRWIVYASEESPSALWIRALDSEEPRRLEGTDGAVRGAFWSPDSRFIGFPTGGQLKKIGIQGGSPIVLCDLQSSGFVGGSWSPDGEVIIFSSGPSEPVLHEVSAAGGTARALPEPLSNEKGIANVEPHFLSSEASSRVLLLSVGARNDRDVYLWDLESGEAVRLVEGGGADLRSSRVYRLSAATASSGFVGFTFLARESKGDRRGISHRPGRRPSESVRQRNASSP